MMKEIGSEFWTAPVCAAGENGLFPPDTVWTGAGRQALTLIIEDIRATRPFHTVALPSWCCHTMIEPFTELGIKPLFYDVLPAPGGGLTRRYPAPGKADATLVMDHFGYADEGPLPDGLGVVIRDLTQGIFTRIPDDADYCFGSLRKWGAFATGGFLWKREGRLRPSAELTSDLSYIEARRAAFARKAAYIDGSSSDKGFLQAFSAANDALRPRPVRAGDPADEAVARRLDVSALRAARRANAAVLLERLAGLAVWPKLGDADCPLFVPVLIPDGKRDAVRRACIERQIYLPVHWPLSPSHAIGEAAARIYERELSLVCDQRYDEADMERLCETVLGALG